MGEWRETRENKEARGKQEGIQCKVADPSAFRHGHFNFHHTENFPNHFNRQREREQRKWTRRRKRLTRLNKSVGVRGLPEKPGHRDV